MTSTKIINKNKSLMLDKKNLEKTYKSSNQLEIFSLQNMENANKIKNKSNMKSDIIDNKIIYSLTETDINKQNIDIPKGEPTQFNLNLNGEIKLNRTKQEKTVVCWNCQSLLLVKPGWQIVECSECNKLNRILPSDGEDNTRPINLGRSYGNLNKKGDIPYMYGIAVCPMCETENKFSKYATNINCYKCGFTIFLKDTPFNNGINSLSQSYDFSPNRNFPNYGYINPPPYNPNVIQIRGLIPVPPIITQNNNDYTLLKILELLQKRPKKTYVPYPIFPYYKLDDEPKQQIRYIPIKERKESKDEDFKITIRKKPKNKSTYKQNGFRMSNNNAFEKVFFTKLK